MGTKSRARSGARFATSTAVALGLVATVVTVVLMQTSVVWAVLMAMGAVVVTASLVFPDQKLYWLVVFLATVPMNVAKLFFLESDDLIHLRSTYGLIVNEIDVAVLYLSDLPLIALVALLLAKVIEERKGLLFPGTAVIAVAFTVWCLCSLVVAHVPLLSASWIFYQVKYLVVFIAIVNACRTRRALSVVVGVLVLGLAVQGALSVTAFVRQSGPDWYGTLFGASDVDQAAPEQTRAYLYVNEGEGLLRGSGTVGVSNETAKFIVPLLPLALAASMVWPALATRAYFLGSFLLGLAGLVCTFSRGGLLAAVIAIAAFLVLMTLRGLLSRRSARLAFAAFLFGALLAAPVLARYLGSRPNYLTMRWEHLRYGLQALFDHPVLGVGINNFNVAFSPQDYGGVFREMAVHNHYLRLGVEVGVIGLLLYCGFFFGVARLSLRCTRARDVSLATLSSAIFAALIGVFFYWLNDLFYSVVFNTQLWVIAALPFVIHQLGVAQSSPSRAPIERPAP